MNELDADRWHGWYVRCDGRVARHDAGAADGWSADTATKFFGLSRIFVRWCYEREHLDQLPRNLASKGQKFERPIKTPPTFSDAEVKALLAAASGPHRLLPLLMLNTGATQRDVADLLKSQVDWAGVSYHPRPLEDVAADGRTVSDRLWPTTLGLLEAHLDANLDELRALTTKGGRPWVWTRTTAAGWLEKSDNVATVLTHLKRRLGWAGPGESLKLFRKTSATALAQHPTHRELRHWFLGHAVRTVTDRHYASLAQGHLDAAVGYLGGRFGQV